MINSFLLWYWTYFQTQVYVGVTTGIVRRERETHLPLGGGRPACSDSQRKRLLSAEGAVNKARHYTKNRTRVRMRAGSVSRRDCTTPQPERRHKRNCHSPCTTTACYTRSTSIPKYLSKNASEGEKVIAHATPKEMFPPITANASLQAKHPISQKTWTTCCYHTHKIKSASFSYW